MKTLIFILSFFYCSFIIGQVVVSDTITVQSTGSGFIQTLTVTYEDGRVVTDSNPLDTLEISTMYINQYQSFARDASQKTIAAISRQRTFNKMKALDDAVNNSLGFSIGDSISRLIFNTYISGDTLEFDSLGTIYSAQILPRVQGGYNLSMNGKTYRILLLDKSWVRVMQFPVPGKRIDLWLYQGTLQSFDGQYRLGKSNLVNRPAKAGNILVKETKPINKTKKSKKKKTNKE